MAGRDRPPSFQFYPRDFMGDPDVQALTWEQRGRYVWALCCSWMSESPGVATEDQWRVWMQYTPSQWTKNRGALAECFAQGEEGMWIQERMRMTRAEQYERFSQASVGGVSRASRLTPEERSAVAKEAAMARWKMRT